jgi:hypothetical protein
MRMIGTAWPLSSILLILAGLALSIVGLYFILVRPSLLPEDMRYMALPAAQLDAVRPQLERWLAHVFQVMGGYILATGLFAITLGATAYREHRWEAATGVLAGGAVSIGWMTVVNFVIRSDFKWFLLGLSLLWASSLVMFFIERRTFRTSANR